MSITANRLRALREERQMSQNDVAKILGISRTAYVKYETGESRPVRKLNELSKLFGVSTDYILGNEDTSNDSLPPLTPKDEREIAKDLENMLESLDGAAAMGDCEDEEDRELLKASLETALRVSKQIAKKKFTPKKYRK